MGPQTLKWVNKWCSKDAECFFKTLNGFQFMRYEEITRDIPKDEKFAYGWMKRIQEYRKEA